MELTCLGSSSRGNCYIIRNESEVLILEAGIKFMEVKKALSFEIGKIVGLLVSHQHNDHAAYIHDYVNVGIMTYALQDVFESKGIALSNSFVSIIRSGKGYKLGGFKVIPFDLKHDVPCIGFLIDHDDMGRLLFITDTMMCEYTFPKLNHVLLECNYSDKVLYDNIEAGRVDASMKHRLMATHMELGTAKDILRANDLSQVLTIILIHLSDGNSDERMFKDEIEKVVGIPVGVADKGLKLNLNKSPF